MEDKLSGALLVLGPEEKQWASRLRAYGLRAVQVPVIRPIPIDEGLRRLEALLRHAGQATLVFTSSLGVATVCSRMGGLLAARRKRGALLVACIGPGTLEALRKHGLAADIVPPTYDGGSLGKALCRDGRGVIVLARSAKGLKDITRILSECHARYIDLAVYDVAVDREAALRAASLWASGKVGYVLLTSPLIARVFLEALRGLGMEPRACGRMVAIGPTTAGEVERLAGCRPPYPSRYSLEGVAEMLGGGAA